MASQSKEAAASPLGGTARSDARGDHTSAAGPPQGRLCERGEAQARSARPRAWMAADTRPLHNLACTGRPRRSRLGAARRRVMTAHRPLSEQVAMAERRLEVRRSRSTRHWHELQADWQRGARWAPLLGVAAMAWLGFALARQHENVTPAQPAPPSLARTGAPGLWVTLAALAGSVLRFAVSPPGRALWNAFRQARAGR